MLTALDSGECVNLMAISDVAKRESLVRVMELLPLQNSPRDGWFKAPGIVSVGGALLMELLEVRVSLLAAAAGKTRFYMNYSLF